MWTRQSATLPQGAFPCNDDSVLWRIWAPTVPTMNLIVYEGAQRREIEMSPVEGGYFESSLPHIPEGFRYAYRPPRVDFDVPDPTSRWQPEGVHRASAVFFPDKFRWTDDSWRGIPLDQLVIYELHVGTFTPAGTLDGVIGRLPQLRELGVNAIELMPVAQFPGENNWGYDGTYPFAVQNSYGGPSSLQRLVDAAHQHGIAVLLDVVYNHLGPEGNYLGLFGPYFTDRYQTPWGSALNYDGPCSDVVRQLVVDNARQWIRDFHLDGLRLDAVQMIFDFGVIHLLQQVSESVHALATELNRQVYVIAETDQNDPRLIQDRSRGGYQLDGVWADDFHHSVHTLLTKENDGYYVDYGEPEQLVKAYEHCFVYDGCYSPYRRRPHGGKVTDVPAERFVVCIQNHDQIGNRPRGDRLSVLVEQSAERMAAGLLLVSAATPLLFMGQEYGESAPFAFFCSFGDEQLRDAVRRGRRQEFTTMAFRWGTENDIPDPTSTATFDAARLAWSWPAGTHAAGLRQLYADLLAWRKSNRPSTIRAEWTNDLRQLRDTRAGCLTLSFISRGEWQIIANLSTTATEPPANTRNDGELRLSTAFDYYGGPRRGDDSRESLFPFELQIWKRSSP